MSAQLHAALDRLLALDVARQKEDREPVTYRERLACNITAQLAREFGEPRS